MELYEYSRQLYLNDMKEHNLIDRHLFFLKNLFII
jgi:hypothetical protein